MRATAAVTTLKQAHNSPHNRDSNQNPVVITKRTATVSLGKLLQSTRVLSLEKSGARNPMPDVNIGREADQRGREPRQSKEPPREVGEREFPVAGLQSSSAGTKTSQRC